MAKLIDLDDLEPVLRTWAKEHHVSAGHLAQLCREFSEKLLTTDPHGALAAQPIPQRGVVCIGYWSPQLHCQWRSVNLDTGELLVDGQEIGGSINVAGYLAIAQTIELMDEQGLDLPVWADEFVPCRWIKQRTFNTSATCPEWVRELASRFNSTPYPLRDRLELWQTDIWGPPPGTYHGKDYRQQWQAR